MPGFGSEVFRARDRCSPVVVYQEGGRRILTFGNEVEQSCMRLDDPARLEYAYTQAMMLAALFVAPPRRALVLGLGGGGLVRALRSGFPACRIAAVESRELVVRVAREYFLLPDDRRVSVQVADAADAIVTAPRRNDLVFADLYGEQGMDGLQVEADFLRHCRDALSPRGLLVLNLWQGEFRASADAERTLHAVFDGRLLRLYVTGGNLVVFAFAGELPPLRQRGFLDEAQAVGRRLHIPLHRLARNLWRQNAELLQLGRYR